VIARAGSKKRMTQKQRVRVLLGMLEDEYSLLAEAGEGGGPMASRRRLDFVREWAAQIEREMDCE
jgi:hypothetical protein